MTTRSEQSGPGTPNSPGVDGSGQPILVYDEQCGFCTWWAAAITNRSSITAVGFDDVGPALERRLPKEYETCAHLITASKTYSCGAAVEAALLSLAPVPTRFREPGPIRRTQIYKGIREGVYRWVAANRGTLGRLLSKDDIDP